MTFSCSRRTRDNWSLASLAVAAIFAGFLWQHAKRIAETDVRVLSILRNVPNGVVVCDVHGNVVFINDAMTTLTGFTREEIISQGIHILMPEEMRKAHDTAFLTAARAAADPAGSVHMAANRPILPVLRKDGTMFKATLTLGTIPRDGAKEFFAFIMPVSSSPADDHTRGMPAGAFEER